MTDWLVHSIISTAQVAHDGFPAGKDILSAGFKNRKNRQIGGTRSLYQKNEVGKPFLLTGTVLKSSFESPEWFFLPHRFPPIPEFPAEPILTVNIFHQMEYISQTLFPTWAGNGLLSIPLMAGYLSSADSILTKYGKITNIDLTNMSNGIIL